MLSDANQSIKERLYYFDNLRIFLLLLVIALHTAQPFGPGGWWYWLELPDRFDFGATFVILGIYFAVSSSFFMGLFFFISGFFVNRSYERKRVLDFFKDRFIRLGIPLIIFVIIIMPLFMYTLCLINLQELSIIPSIMDCISSTFEFHHLWFVAQLFAFNIGFILWRLIKPHSDEISKENNNKIPNTMKIISFIVILTIITFIVRIWSPAIKWDPIGVVEFARLPNYLSLFCLGILASNRDWVKNMPSSTGYRWLAISIISIVLLPVLFFMGGGMDPLLGGIRWQAFVYAAWEAVVGIGMAIGLVVLFRDKINLHNKLLESLAANVYSVYLIHVPIIVYLQIVFINIRLPSLAIIGLILLIGVPLCFLISHYLIKRLPYAKKIL